MLGVPKEFQSQNVAHKLLLSQKISALTNGFTEMKWAFDPLDPRCANLYLHKCGAKIESPYISNMYEELITENSIPTDRFMATWNLNEKINPNSFKNIDDLNNYEINNFLIKGIQEDLTTSFTKNLIAVAFPFLDDTINLKELSKKARILFSEYLVHYDITDFIKIADNSSFYLLQKKLKR